MASKRDAERMFARMAQAAAQAGMDVGGWSLQPGSTVNGISWSVLSGRGGASSLVGLPPFGHIGKTATEAEHFLAGMVAAFESINYDRDTRKA